MFNFPMPKFVKDALMFFKVLLEGWRLVAFGFVPGLVLGVIVAKL